MHMNYITDFLDWILPQFPPLKITAHLNGNTTALLYERWTDDVPTHVEGEPNVLCYKLPTKLSSRLIFEFLRPVLDTIGRPLNKVTSWNCFYFKNQVHSLCLCLLRSRLHVVSF